MREQSGSAHREAHERHVDVAAIDAARPGGDEDLDAVGHGAEAAHYPRDLAAGQPNAAHAAPPLKNGVRPELGHCACVHISKYDMLQHERHSTEATWTGYAGALSKISRRLRTRW